MKQGYRDGILSKRRLNEAVMRILGLKASLGLHRGVREFSVQKAEHALLKSNNRTLARKCADEAITLVKEEPGVLPITPEKYPRILYYPLEAETAAFGYSVRGGACEQFRQALIARGFKVDIYQVDKANMEGHISPTTEILDNYDLCLYLANYSTKSNQTTVRIEWMQPMGANCPVYIHEKPIVFISVENPYHLIDVPRVKTYINAYCSTDAVLESLLDKLTGKDRFIGRNPEDPFCGKWDTRL